MSERTEKAHEPERDFLQQIRHLITEFRAKGGRKVASFGDHLLLLTTVGARTERARTVPLVFSNDGERCVVAASNAGSPKNPHWFHNLRANPSVWVEIEGKWFEAAASVAEGAERERLFTLHAERLPQLHEYQARAGRAIPIVVLVPKSHD